MSKPTASGGRRAGFTLIEMMISLSVVSVVFSAMYVVVLGVSSYFGQGNLRSALEEDGRRTMRAMISELRQTGIVEDGGVNYPAIYSRAVMPMDGSNVRGDLLATLSLRDADLGGYFYDPNSGTRAEVYRDRESTELVFRHLAVRRMSAMDLNLRPILDNTTGDVQWADNEYSFLVVTGPGGVPQLERRVNGGNPRIIGRYVDKVVFEAISHDPTVFYNQIIIVLYMSRQVGSAVISTDLEGTVNLRNTREIE